MNTHDHTALFIACLEALAAGHHLVLTVDHVWTGSQTRVFKYSGPICKACDHDARQVYCCPGKLLSWLAQHHWQSIDWTSVQQGQRPVRAA